MKHRFLLALKNGQPSVITFMNLCLIPLIVSASGCRFGNRVESQPSEDQLSGYYLTEPQNLTFYVINSNQTLQESVDPSEVPTLIKQYLTNPVLFGLLNPKTGEAGLADPQNPSRAFPTGVDTSGNLAYVGQTRPQTHWLDPLCKSHLEVIEKGQLLKQSVQSPEGFQYPLSGRLKLTFQVITQFEGDCRDTFQALQDCLADAEQCGGADAEQNETLKSAVLASIQPWVDAGILDPSSLSDLTGYAYEVSYE